MRQPINSKSHKTMFIGLTPPEMFMMRLTEKDSEEFVLSNHFDEKIAIDVLNGVLLHLVEKPGQEFAFLPRIS